MKILGIESSCDETAASLIEDGSRILTNVVVSQVDIFAAYGGVIPEVASRSHLEAILPVVDQALAGYSWDDVDAIAVTHTPGLLGSLLVGTLTARTLALLHNKPLYPVHHLKSHIYANWLEPSTSANSASGAHPNFAPTIEFPLLALVVSGGHTQILYMDQHNHFDIIGTTRDDAVGECFDKVAKILGLPYPGGPAIAKAASSGDPLKYRFPHPNVSDLDFSFSGLKTAVLREVQHAVGKPISFPSHELAALLTPEQVADFAASFQRTAVDILLEKLEIARRTHPARSIVLAGGVSANSLLREQALARFPDVPVFFPEPKFSGDNAAMVAAAAFYEIQSGVQPTDPYSLDISPRSTIH